MRKFFEGVFIITSLAALVFLCVSNAQLKKRVDSIDPKAGARTASNEGGGGTPGGSNTQVQYNNAGAFGGTSAFTFDSATGRLVVPTVSSTNALLSNVTSTNLVFTTASGTNATIQNVTVPSGGTTDIWGLNSHGTGVVSALSFGGSADGPFLDEAAGGQLSISNGTDYGPGIGILYARLNVDNLTTFERMYTFPDRNGTFALFDNSFHLFTTSTAPAVSACGGSPSIIGTDTDGEVTVGSTATSCTVTFENAYLVPTCVISFQSYLGAPGEVFYYTITTTGFEVNSADLADTKFNYSCKELGNLDA